MTLPQSYAQRVRARPAYAKYKNAKQYLRRQVSKGRLTMEQREQLQEQAYAAYIRDRHKTLHDLAPEGWMEWAILQGFDATTEDAGAVGRCNPSCWYARKPKCRCVCEGRWHGGNHGRG